MTLAALRTNAVLIAVFGTVLVALTLLRIGELAEGTTVLQLGGYVGLLDRRLCLVRLRGGGREPDLGSHGPAGLPDPAPLSGH